MSETSRPNVCCGSWWIGAPKSVVLPFLCVQRAFFKCFYSFLFLYEFQHFVCCAFILLFVKRKKRAEVGSGDLLLYIFRIWLVTCAVFVLCWNGQDDCVLHIV